MPKKVYYIQEREFCIICLKEITGTQWPRKYCHKCGAKIAKNQSLIRKRKNESKLIKKVYIYWNGWKEKLKKEVLEERVPALEQQKKEGQAELE